MALGGVVANRIVVGLTQYTAGANGLINDGDCIGVPPTDAGVYAVGCTLYQRDSSTNYSSVVWQNTGTTAVPVWTQLASGGVIASGATLTLLQTQTGATILLNTAGGTTVTLPAPKVGLKFTFIASVTASGGSLKVITDAASTFLLGMVVVAEASAATALGALADGTTIVAITMNGTTTGGIKGTRFTVECISATVWEISGLVAGSGSLSTPFATS